MRLIDADKLIEDMRNKWDMQDFYLPIHFKEFLVDEQPTAYDVEVVIEQIKNLKNEVSDIYHVDEAIDLVKAGGI